ncbi:MAG: BON domain-containing protein [Chloroflexi bacterium]|jgi:hypothetical protein|nr:BON domain-containing protein [Chloroflexota bacterium]
MSFSRMIMAALAGAGAMFLLDPRAGRRRRALIRDKAVRYQNEAAGVMDDLSNRTEDLKNRTGGMVAETKSRFKDEPVSDHVLEERVRAEIGRWIKNAGAIEVRAQDGDIFLHGPVLAKDVDQLLTKVQSVRGVNRVENRLQMHEHAGNIPGLQTSNRYEDS